MKKYTLIINTGHNQEVEIAVMEGDKTAARKKFAAEYKQAEMLLPAIDKMLKKNKIVLGNIEKIRVVNKGGSFTALRIGVITANALGYALGIPVEGTAAAAGRKKIKFDIVEPMYEKEPNITVSKK